MNANASGSRSAAPARLGRGALWGSAAACVIVVVIALLSVRANRRLEDAIRWQFHTYEVLGELKNAQISLGAVWGEVRLYLAQPERTLSDRLTGEFERIERHVENVIELTRDNPSQNQRMRGVLDAVRGRAAAIKEAIRLGEGDDDAGARAFLASDRAGMHAARIAEMVAGAEQTELELLDDRRSEAGTMASQARMVAVGGGALVLAIMVAAWVMVWREGTRRVALEMERRSAAEQLQVANHALTGANDALARSNKKLETSNSELEAFTYTVSHDLRAPLRAIDGFSRILAEECSDRLTPEALRYLARVRGGAQQMGMLIDDLLAFSRLSRQSMRTAPVDMAGLTRLCAQQLREAEPGREVDVVIGDLPPVVGDATLLRQAMTNLLSNALKFTRRRPGARVEVGYMSSAAPGGAYYVQDNGAGFDMRYADKLFGVFQRLHRAEDFEGTGVGLAIVQRVVTRHGGRVWALGEPDKGATFSFTLPGVTSDDAAPD